MSLQNIAMSVLLMISMLATASTLHYKNRLQEFTMQKHINDKSTIALVRQLADLTKEIRIATYPAECDNVTKEIIGNDCDVGNYMEWAGPHLEHETEQLFILLSRSQYEGDL